MSNRISFKTVLIASLALVILAAAVPPAPLDAQAKAKTPAAKDADPYTDLSLGAFKLRPIGPALTSGRISDFAVRPGKRPEFFVASASGGVWKTVNAGVFVGSLGALIGFLVSPGGGVDSTLVFAGSSSLAANENWDRLRAYSREARRA